MGITKSHGVKTKYLYIMGSASSAGKSTVCLGILVQLLTDGYKPEQLAYFKPVTQCTDQQAVMQFCQCNHIPYLENSALIFETGFSKAFINGLQNTSDNLLTNTLTKITRFGTGRKLVVIDGIGDPSTGSVVGVSNADIARALNATVIFVGIPGIGSAIDNTVLCLSYLQTKGIKDIGLIYNKIAPVYLADITFYVSKRVKQLLPNATLLGFIMENTTLKSDLNKKHSTEIAQWFSAHIDSKAFKHFVLEN